MAAALFRSLRETLRASRGLLTGRAGYRLCQFLGVVILVKLTEPTVVGEFGVAQSIVAPIFAFMHFDLGRLLASDAGDEASTEEYLVIQVPLALLGFLLALIVAYLWDPTLLLLTASVGSLRVGELFTEVVLGGYLRNGIVKGMSRSFWLKGLSYLLSLGVGLTVMDSLEGGLLLAAFVHTLILLAYDFPLLGLKRGLSGHAMPSSLRVIEICRHGLPAGLRTTLGSVLTMTPRYLLAVMSGTAAVGYFVSVSQLMQVGALVNMSMIQSYLPRLREEIGEGDRKFRVTLKKMALFSLSLGTGILVVFLLFGEALLTLLFTLAYSHLYWATVVILVASALRHLCGVLSAGLLTQRRLVAETGAMVIVAAVGLISGILLIEPYGVLGAAFSLVVAGVGQLIFLYRLLGPRPVLGPES